MVVMVAKATGWSKASLYEMTEDELMDWFETCQSLEE